MLRKKIVLICISIIILFCSRVYADSAAALVDSGNKSWIAGDYEDALKKYNEATVDDPESPYIYFNKGTALYKKGNYNDAVYAFEKAALKSKDPHMESKSRFNLGNCAFREAERQMDSDLKKSLEYCEKSIKHFHDALKLDPGLNEAAENIEVVRLVMKNILDEIKKQEQEAKKNKEALKPPDQDQDSQQKQEGQKGQQDQQENQQQSSEKESSKQEQPQKEEQAAVQNAGEDPQDILDEEKENKERRRVMSSGGYSEVEKDW
ncbi:tetratricopeptide repeat protein [Thermodesulfobacteriota bacterium]